MKDPCGYTKSLDGLGVLTCDRGEGHPDRHWDDNKGEYF